MKDPEWKTELRWIVLLTILVVILGCIFLVIAKVIDPENFRPVLRGIYFSSSICFSIVLFYFGAIKK